MRYNSRDLERLARSISEELESEINKAGIFYRIFFRCKDRKSLEKKLSLKTDNGLNKYNNDKLLRDLIGIRINLYFADDLSLLKEFYKRKYSHLYVEETVDENDTTEFKPTRANYIFKIPEKLAKEFQEVVTDIRIDSTFELQLRTVLSEGWHEVEHDLRYKCKEDWEPYPEMSRMFNGFLASLETQEWSMIQLLERISYSHYKNENFAGLIRTKLRIRLDDYYIDPELIAILKSDPTFCRELFKLERLAVVSLLLEHRPLFPLTINNLIFAINYSFIGNPTIEAMIPEALLPYLNETFSNRKKLP